MKWVDVCVQLGDGCWSICMIGLVKFLLVADEKRKNRVEAERLCGETLDPILTSTNSTSDLARPHIRVPRGRS